MYIVTSYSLAIFFCFITMLCWGSWGNTQKLAGKTWRYELFYWDYVIGVLLLSLIFAFTLGSTGSSGRSFIADLEQAEWGNIGSAFLGGVIWAIGNSLNLIAAGRAGAAISYGLGQGATLVAALWGVFVWKEFKNAPKGTNVLLTMMFVLFLAGIISIIYAGQ